MALVRDQQIPPPLLEDYNNAFGQARHRPSDGHQPNGDVLVAPAAYNPIAKTRPPPSWEQARERAYFKAAVNCFNGAPTNERRAYWRLSALEGMWYYNYYMENALQAFLKGATCQGISRPLTLSLRSEYGAKTGGVFANVLHCDPLAITYELTIDPCTLNNQPLSPCQQTAPYQINHRWFDEGDYQFKCQILATFDPDQRKDYIGVVNVPEITHVPWIPYRNVSLWRNTNDTGEAVVWLWEQDPEGPTPTGWNFD